MRKILAVSLAAALSLSLAPAASAQLSSSSSFFPSSSDAVSQQPTQLQALEEAIASLLNRMGHTRVAQYDRAAQSMVDDALAGKVTWRAVPSDLIDNFAGAAYRDLSYNYTIYRFPASDADLVIENTRSLDGFDIGIYGPYGLAVGADANWIYYAVAEPRTI